MVTGDVRTPLAVLFGAVSLVLLIATANVANLLLLRGEARRPELAVRAALGATWGRLARQALAESLVLSLAAGALALAASRAMLGGLIALLPDRLPRPDSVRVDAGVLLFTIAVAFLAASLAGLAPALVLRARGRRGAPPRRRSRGDAARGPDGTSGAGGRAGDARGGRRDGTRRCCPEPCCACRPRTWASPPTASPSSSWTCRWRNTATTRGIGSSWTPRSRVWKRRRACWARRRSTPGPFAGTGGWDSPSFTAEGQTLEEAAANPSLNLESVHPGYFRTLGVTLVRGREFTDRDRAGATEVAVVSEDVAARIWPGQDPIGRRLKFGNPTSDETWRTVVGVARPTRYRELTHPRPTLYVPANQFIAAATTLVLRTAEPVGRVAEIARRSLHEVDPGVTVLRVLPFAEAMDKPLARPRFNAYLIGVFAVTALLLATIGVYAVIAASVRQRYAEIGVRVALGATRADVRRLVLGEGVRLAALGAAIGVGGALLAGRLVQDLLYEVQPHDPPSLLGAAVLLVAVAALASYLPARRPSAWTSWPRCARSSRAADRPRG